MRRTGMPIRGCANTSSWSARAAPSPRSGDLLELHRREVLSRVKELRLALTAIDEKVAYYRRDKECLLHRNSKPAAQSR
jgi:hypothetical protein